MNLLHFNVFSFLLLLFCSTSTLLASPETCQSTSCKTLSDTLLHRSMNTSVKPCDDFHEYICGNYPKFNPINPADGYSDPSLTRQAVAIKKVEEALKHAQNSSSKAIKYVSQFYSECLDTAAWQQRGTKPLLDLIEETVGGWPMIGKVAAANGTRKWHEIFVNSFSKAGQRVLFDITGDNLEVLKITPGRGVMNPKNVYSLGKISNSTVIAHYRQFLLNLTDILGTGVNNSKLLHDIEQLVHFESRLEIAYNNVFEDGETFTGTAEQFELSVAHKVPWVSVLSAIYANLQASSHTNFTRAPFTRKTVIESSHVHYIRKVIAIIEETPIEVLQNYFATAIALDLGRVTAPKLQNAIQAFTSDPKKKFAVDCADIPRYWLLVMGRAYVDSYFPKEKKDAATALVSEIKASFRENFAKRNQWMDETTKRAAVEKLNAISIIVGFPKWITDNQEFDNFYPELKSEEVLKLAFFEKVVRLRVKSIQFELSLENFRLKSHDEHLELNPVASVAYNNLKENRYIITAALLQPPFLDFEAVDSWNYGAAGAIIARELSHSFDETGSDYNAHGYLDNWWTAATKKAFEEKAKCMIKQYSDIVDPRAGENLEGAQTLDENIKDNGGIKEAFFSFQAHQKKKTSASKVLPGLEFNSDQLFFVSYANMFCEAITKKKLQENIAIGSHSPNKYRVNVVLSNFDQFANAFHCPVGSKMNPAHKCSVW